MRLFVSCPINGTKIVITTVAPTHALIPESFTVTGNPCGHAHTFNRGQVRAEPTPGAAAGGAVAGGLIGLLGGPIGLVLGGTFGAALGANAEKADRLAAERFNAEVGG